MTELPITDRLSKNESEVKKTLTAAGLMPV